AISGPTGLRPRMTEPPPGPPGRAGPEHVADPLASPVGVGLLEHQDGAAGDLRQSAPRPRPLGLSASPAGRGGGGTFLGHDRPLMAGYAASREEAVPPPLSAAKPDRLTGSGTGLVTALRLGPGLLPVDQDDERPGGHHRPGGRLARRGLELGRRDE